MDLQVTAQGWTDRGDGLYRDYPLWGLSWSDIVTDGVPRFRSKYTQLCVSPFHPALMEAQEGQNLLAVLLQLVSNQNQRKYCQL